MPEEMIEIEKPFSGLTAWAIEMGRNAYLMEEIFVAGGGISPWLMLNEKGEVVNRA